MEKRFVIVEKQGFSPQMKVIVDTQTGVQYLYVSEGYSGGLTVLVDREGKPVIDRDHLSYGE